MHDEFPNLAKTLGLVRTGHSWHGACPSCGYPSGFTATMKDGRLLFYCHAGGCSYQTVIRAIESRVGDLHFNRVRPAKAAKVAKVKDALFVQSLWNNSQAPEGTPVEAYLRRRGFTDPIPKTIRFAPQLLHTDTQANYPGMVCAITDSLNPDCVRGLHRTFFAHQAPEKAAIIPNKKSMGCVKGNAVQLARASNMLCITEGVETGLSVLQATKLPTWAALSAYGMETLVLPPLPIAQHVYICADNDAVGLQKAYELAKRLHREGRHVVVVSPPGPGQDFNDLLLSGNAAAQF